MNFIADNTPDKEEYTHGRTITQEYIQEYLAQRPNHCTDAEQLRWHYQDCN